MARVYITGHGQRTRVDWFETISGGWYQIIADTSDGSGMTRLEIETNDGVGHLTVLGSAHLGSWFWPDTTGSLSPGTSVPSQGTNPTTNEFPVALATLLTVFTVYLPPKCKAFATARIRGVHFCGDGKPSINIYPVSSLNLA